VRRRPQFIIVEDLHWADAELLAMLAQLAAALSERAGLLLLSTRIDGDPIDVAWRARARDALLATIELRPLSGPDAIKLAQQLSTESEDFVRRCVERAEGNPLFLEQLLRSRASDQEDHLPPSLHSVVLARLDRLEHGDKRAIEAAAILGQRFRLGDLRSLLGNGDYDPAELARRHLVRPEGSEISFAHALIRDGVYASLTLGRRAQLHRAAASLFESDDPAMSAEHLDRAGDPEAPAAYLRAARSEAALLHVARALHLAKRGLAIATKPQDLFQLATQVGSLQRDLGQGEPALASYEKAHRHAADENQRIAAMVGMASANRLLGRVTVGLQQTEILAPKVGGIDDDRMAAEFHTLRGNLAFAAANIALCKSSHKAALEAAERAGSVEWRIRALGGLGDAAYAEGYLATARRYFTECVDLADANGFIRVASPNRGMRANCEVYFLEIAEAERQCELALADAHRIGDRYLEMFAKECAAFTLLVAERSEQLAESAGEALALSRELKTDRYTSILLICFVIAVRHRRSRAELIRLCQEALDLAKHTSLTFAGPMIYGVYALVEPDPARQAELIRQGEALLQETSLVHNHAHFHRLAIEWALEHHHWSKAEHFADNLAAYFAARERLPYIDLLVDRARALAALGRNPGDTQSLTRVTALRDIARSRGLAISFPPLND
jgi:tetratricopeptide (TPR) repeat protein